MAQRREQPHIAKTDRIANQHQNKLSSVFPTVSFTALMASPVTVMMVVVMMMMMVLLTVILATWAIASKAWW